MREGQGGREGGSDWEGAGDWEGGPGTREGGREGGREGLGGRGAQRSTRAHAHLPFRRVRRLCVWARPFAALSVAVQKQLLPLGRAVYRATPKPPRTTAASACVPCACAGRRDWRRLCGRAAAGAAAAAAAAAAAGVKEGGARRGQQAGGAGAGACVRAFLRVSNTGWGRRLRCVVGCVCTHAGIGRRAFKRSCVSGCCRRRSPGALR